MTIKYEYHYELARDTFWEMLILKTKEETGRPLRTVGQDVYRTLHKSSLMKVFGMSGTQPSVSAPIALGLYLDNGCPLICWSVGQSARCLVGWLVSQSIN
jgi:hypothetical protein